MTNPGKEVSFFLRIHRHLPDKKCGGFVLGNCNYREDGIPINIANDYVSELKKNKEFVKKEQEIQKLLEDNN